MHFPPPPPSCVRSPTIQRGRRERDKTCKSFVGLGSIEQKRTLLPPPYFICLAPFFWRKKKSRRAHANEAVKSKKRQKWHSWFLPPLLCAVLTRERGRHRSAAIPQIHHAVTKGRLPPQNGNERPTTTFFSTSPPTLTASYELVPLSLSHSLPFPSLDNHLIYLSTPPLQPGSMLRSLSYSLVTFYYYRGKRKQKRA